MASCTALTALTRPTELTVPKSDISWAHTVTFSVEFEARKLKVELVLSQGGQDS